MRPASSNPPEPSLTASLLEKAEELQRYADTRELPPRMHEGIVQTLSRLRSLAAQPERSRSQRASREQLEAADIYLNTIRQVDAMQTSMELELKEDFKRIDKETAGRAWKRFKLRAVIFVASVAAIVAVKMLT